MASGLIVEDLVLGEGPACTSPEAVVVVRFKGMLTDGRVFDSTMDRSGDGYPLKELIRGWQEGIPGMRVGGTRRLTIPWRLAYGDREIRMPTITIPAQSDVVFEINLVDLK
ncbi:MAG: FKBP-type peptidyl-prolyl cis-trans isomerase [Phycisphaeraceae bacterium]|nr:FKBP-type peptidyl-prolyl cis-trans isomerase [Phycisphaeraceae bacterium]